MEEKEDISDVELERLTLYLRCLIAYYEHYANATQNDADKHRANVLRIVLDDIQQGGRMELTIARLRQFLPDGA